MDPETLVVSADGKQAQCSACEKKIDFKVPKNWSPQYKGGNFLTNCRNHLNACSKNKSRVVRRKPSNEKDEAHSLRPNLLGFATVPKNNGVRGIYEKSSYSSSSSSSSGCTASQPVNYMLSLVLPTSVASTSLARTSNVVARILSNEEHQDTAEASEQDTSSERPIETVGNETTE